MGDEVNKKRILIADDDTEYAKLLARHFESEGYETLYAGNGQESIITGQTEKPDLIIMDIDMPLKDGVDATISLSADESTKNIPVIFLTGMKTIAEEQNKGTSFGRHKVFAKPANFEKLLKEVKTELEKVKPQG